MKIPYLRNISLFAFCLPIILFGAGCKKSATTTTDTVTIPVVTTNNAILNLTTTTAQAGGVVTSAGNGIITANGVCYSATNKTPTTSDTKTSEPVTFTGVGLQTFLSTLTTLTAGTTYYLRAYATNSAGTGYGSVLQFTTSTSLTSINTAVTTFAGSSIAGYADASGLSAQFNNPQAITADSKGNLYVSDSFNDLIREITPAGNVSTVAGTLQTIGYADGPAASAQFYAPHGSAFDSQGNLYVADFGNNVIRKITPDGTVSTYAGSGKAGYRNGASTSATLKNSTDSLALFNNPQAVAVDAQGNVYVADFGNNVIRKILPTGRVITIAGARGPAGYLNGTDEAAYFHGPTGIAVDSQGNVYVTDQGNSAIRKITPDDVVTTIAGGPLLPGLLNFPSGITIDPQGNLYVVDEGGRVLECTNANAIYVLAGSLNNSGLVNGAGTAAQFNNPQGITIDAKGNLYVADQYNNCIRKVTITVN